MRLNAIAALVLASTCLTAPALAGEKPLLGAVPDWVVPAPALAADQASVRKAQIALLDQQTLIDGDLTVTYTDAAVHVANQAMLNAVGTLKFNWQPAHGDLTVHRVEILRGGERIDVLGDGSRLTVLRREEGLESLSLTGQLTAILTAPGLRVGDVLRMTTSITVRDKALGGKAQAAQMLVPAPATIGFGRVRMVWPEAQQVQWKALIPGLTAAPVSIPGGRRELTVMLPVAKLPDLPGDIPLRFRPLPIIEATNFASWQDLAATMAPLYSTEGTIAEGSDLARTVDALAAQHKDPVERIAAALRSVQGDVRYQLMAMGSGNYVPQTPAETWQQRYGDCKAKTLLLLAMLHRMGITAEPVLASSSLGDAVPSRLPAPLAFDHVFVRAEVAGESFWLDGTGLGARLADIRDVPNFGYVLPLRKAGAAPLRLPTRADARPAFAAEIDYDASAGLHLPVPATLRLTYSGAPAEMRRASEDQGQAEELREFAEGQAKRLLGTTAITAPRAVYDKEAATWTMTVAGVAFPDWTYADGHWSIAYGPMASIDFEADRSKAAWRDLPALVSNPATTAVSWTLRLPERAAAATLENADPVELKLPAAAYTRRTTRDGLVIRSSELAQETAAEVPPAEIGAMRKAVNDIAAREVRIVAPGDYPQRWEQVEQSRKSPAFARIRAVYDQRIADKPDEAERYAERAWFLMRSFDWAGAEADYGKAIALDPTAGRYLARAELRAARGDTAGQLKDAQAAYDLDTDDKGARQALASALSEVGKTDEALALTEAEPDPSSEEGEGELIERAQALADGGRTAEAIALLGAGLKKRPSSASLLNGRCWVQALASTGLDAALTDCTRAIELAADPAAFYDSRAMVHFRAGRFDQARADLDAALAIAPEIPHSRFMRAVVAARLGDKSAAASDLAAARKLRPSIDSYFAKYGIKP